MTENYSVSYSEDALNDLKEIYTYIAEVLLAPQAAAAQVGRIRKEVRSLKFMPTRYREVEWEPWHSMGMHQLPVNNYIVYFLIDEDLDSIAVVRIFYGGRDIEGIATSHESSL